MGLPQVIHGEFCGWENPNLKWMMTGGIPMTQEPLISIPDFTIKIAGMIPAPEGVADHDTQQIRGCFKGVVKRLVSLVKIPWVHGLYGGFQKWGIPKMADLYL